LLFFLLAYFPGALSFFSGLMVILFGHEVSIVSEKEAPTSRVPSELALWLPWSDSSPARNPYCTPQLGTVRSKSTQGMLILPYLQLARLPNISGAWPPVRTQTGAWAPI